MKSLKMVFTKYLLLIIIKNEGKADIPIVAVTANAFEEDKKLALSVGMNGHLAKPYDIGQIRKTLIELLI